ncbi:hypothetical protein F3J24_09185 [Comamonas sp. Tr-654]|uniref:hypothetical protein n=1 Tax=Comamonas sp. Tr-654 TaxID=2608341 RepID=UPI0014202EBF|nr:hypothetical protein [Comamonas sp. Tr-654]NIF83673.1 hypothetical protein [Comamonas sp. Tr-654]
MPSDKPASLEEIQASIAKLRVTEQQLEATAQKYESKMQSSRKWNYLAVAMAVVVCAVAWINQASPWLRWGVLPVVLFMVLFFEGMRRLLGVTMQSSMRQLKTQIRTLETRMAEVQATTAKDQP